MSRVVELRIDKTDLGKAVDLLVDDAAIERLSVVPHPPVDVTRPSSAFDRGLVIVLRPDEPGGLKLHDAPGHEADEAFAKLLRDRGVTVHAHRIVGGTRT